MADLRAIVLTDIQGSTALWNENEDAMRAALADHDELLSSQFAAHQGEIFKKVGDGFLVSFPDFATAADCLIATQKLLLAQNWPTAQPLKVRMTLAEGMVEARGGDYFGVPVNLASRLADAGHGGQVLTSGVNLAQLPPGIEGIPLGDFEFQGFPEPLPVYQLHAAGLPTEFPALRAGALFLPPGNIPFGATAFLGRRQELFETRALIDRHRILTLTGSAGCGKTRLCQEFARQAWRNFPGGAWWVNLVPVADADQISLSLWEAMEPGQPVPKDVGRVLAAKIGLERTLLVLDNAEHLLDATAQWVENFAGLCPNLRFLVTSREPLALPGEAVYRVKSLGVPSTLDQEKIEDSEAVQFFREKARGHSVVPVEELNPQLVATLVKRLDGIPLALELAATRLRNLTIEEMVERLDDRFRLLSSGFRTSLARQKTLEAAFDWSYDLLTSEEQMAFATLGVFASRWSKESAREVLASRDAADLVDALVDKSLVVFDPHQSEAPYSMLESLKDYSERQREKLGIGLDVRGRHAEWVASRCDVEALKGPSQMQAAIKLQALEPDMIQAAYFAVASPETLTLAAKIASSYWRSKYRQGSSVSVLRDLKGVFPALLEGPVNSVFLDSRRAYAWALYLSNQSQEAYTIALSAEKLAREAGLEADQGHALMILGGIYSLRQDTDNCITSYKKSLEIFERIGDRSALARAHQNLGSSLTVANRKEEAIGHLIAAKQILEEQGDKYALGWVSWSLANHYLSVGELDQALILARHSVEIRNEVKDMRGIAFANLLLAAIFIEQMALGEARERWQKGAQLSENWEDPWAKAFSCFVGIHLALAEERWEIVIVGESSITLSAATLAVFGTDDQGKLKKWRSEAESHLTQAELEEATGKGKEMDTATLLRFLISSLTSPVPVG